MFDASTEKERRIVRPTDYQRQTRTRGTTLIEVTISILLVTVTILAAMMVRYQVARQAVRADAYETAARVGQLLLEGWRSTDLNVYEPNDRFPEQLMFQQADAGPDVTADGFTPYVSPNGVTNYEAILHNRHYYATLGYIPAVMASGSERPPVIHVAVGFLNSYGVWDGAANVNTVKLTSHK